MKHNVIIENYGIRLRPVTLADSEFIVNLRNGPSVKGKIGNVPNDVRLQEQWIERYFDRDGDYYFIIESLSGISQGTIGITLHDDNPDVIGPGRLVLFPNSFAALPASILINNYCFENLQLDVLKGVIFSNNEKVISFDLRLGYKIKGYSDIPISADNDSKIYRIELTKKDWFSKLPVLEELANRSIRFQLK